MKLKQHLAVLEIRQAITRCETNSAQDQNEQDIECAMIGKVSEADLLQLILFEAPIGWVKI